MTPAPTAQRCNRPSSGSTLETLVTTLRRARARGPLRILLDYDGTLVPIAPAPHLAVPDEELLALLAALVAAPDLDVEIVSGRTRDWLQAFFHHLPMALWAEHAFWHRPAGQPAWQAALPVTAGWADPILPTLRAFTERTPGSHLEIKSASLAWHFRGVAPEVGARRAGEIGEWLREVCGPRPLDVLEGKKVIEVRLAGISKALAASPPLAAAADTVVAFGDDHTDEDLFGALPPASVTIAVGQSLAHARHDLADHRQVRALLRSLL